MRKLAFRLIGSRSVRVVIKALRLHVLGNWWLRQFPVVRTLPRSGIRYRARRVDSLGLAAEMFESDAVYSASDLPAHIRTFADLGCNVGYFTCWLCDQLKTRQLKGLLVDANAEAVEDARWQVATNGLSEVHVLHGLAGASGKDGHATFYLHAANVCSTAVPSEAALRQPFTWTATEVPCLSIEESWQSLFGDVPCDLLKVDIEGSEVDFFRAETAFLARVGTIIVEWHKSRVGFAEMEILLSGRGFSLKSVVREDPKYGTAVFSRKPS